MISVVITSMNRLDLLKRTVDSFMQMNTYPIKEFILIEDSGLEEVHTELRRMYPNFHLILNEKNIGAYESIDKAYSFVKTPYVFHTEDDWEYIRPNFIEPSLDVLLSDPMLMQVWLSNTEGCSIYPELLRAGNTNYRIAGPDKDNFWHGFTCHPGLRSMAGYRMTAPWTQWINKTDPLSVQECTVGEAYYRLGYKAGVLLNTYTEHIGIGRCTWHEN
jgi:glycosyltransferase involved in cell wall biosynthesis